MTGPYCTDRRRCFRQSPTAQRSVNNEVAWRVSTRSDILIECHGDVSRSQRVRASSPAEECL